MVVQIFQDDESGYIDWVMNNPNGYVVNSRREFDPQYLVLHRACCSTILKHRNMETKPGGFTERNYQKICASSVTDLVDYLVGSYRNQNPFSKLCSRCNPESV